MADSEEPRRERNWKDVESQNIRLSVPWAAEPTNEGHSMEAFLAAQFVEERSRVHETFIRETEKTKRLGYGLAASLLATACILPVFAPVGHEVISWWISASLFVFAAGAMGYTHVSAKLKDRQISLIKQSDLARDPRHSRVQLRKPAPPRLG
jgi:hypothetical protein